MEKFWMIKKTKGKDEQSAMEEEYMAVKRQFCEELNYIGMEHGGLLWHSGAHRLVNIWIPENIGKPMTDLFVAKCKRIHKAKYERQAKKDAMLHAIYMSFLCAIRLSLIVACIWTYCTGLIPLLVFISWLFELTIFSIHIIRFCWDTKRLENWCSVLRQKRRRILKWIKSHLR